VRELVRAWAAGEGATHGPLPPTIFIVGDRKQSIYGFRDAEVAVLDAAGRFIEALRPDSVRAAITRSFRSVRPLLSFVNDVCAAVEKAGDRPDAFRYDEHDAFPLGAGGDEDADAVGVVTAPSDEAQAAAVAEEIARLLGEGLVVRDRQHGVRRPIEPGDVAILFRTREGHQWFEEALGRRGVPYYVYKGLGFFDAAEVKDVLALIAYLADPASNLRAAAFLRSRVVGLSDEALKLLAPGLADALVLGAPRDVDARLAADDRERLAMARGRAGAWVSMADRVAPADLIDRVLAESAYAAEMTGPGRPQARENLKKVRGLIRRIQNRGYATLGRMAEFFDQLVAGGDESNAMIDAAGAVSLMTVHAAKGLEFPVVFMVNLGKGSGGGRDAIRIATSVHGGDDDEGGEVSVGVGEHLTDADRDRDAQEHEEMKRLLYVALTRARDRLYLCATHTDGRIILGRGAMGRVLPASLLASMADTSDADRVVWRGAAEPHVMRRVPAAADRSFTAVAARVEPTRREDFRTLAPTGPARVSAVVAAAEGAPMPGIARPGSRPSAVEVGILAHRLIARVWRRAPQDAQGIAREAATLARSVGFGDDPQAVVDAATRYCRQVIGRADVQEALGSGTPLFEAPVALRGADGRVVRGSIDCLVMGADRITVMEFKTGAPTPSHDAQIALYAEAVRRFARGVPVVAHLVYAMDEP